MTSFRISRKEKNWFVSFLLREIVVGTFTSAVTIKVGYSGLFHLESDLARISKARVSVMNINNVER